MYFEILRLYHCVILRLFSSTECDAPATVTPEGNDTSVDSFWIDGISMLAVLDLEVDYEVETFYVMVIEVVDFLRTPVLTGQATLKVRRTVFTYMYSCMFSSLQ